MLQRSRRNVNGDGKRSEIKPKKTKITEIEAERQREGKSYPAIHSVEHKVGSRRGDQVRRCCCCYDEEQQKWQTETPLQELHCCYLAAARLPQNRGNKRAEKHARADTEVHTREREGERERERESGVFCAVKCDVLSCDLNFESIFLERTFL